MGECKNETISIIVPVYNVENELARCVDSIINQSYKDLEIILVDDGSTDRSGEICDDIAQKDPRILVIHKKNGGLSSARNAGLDAASGKYVGFVDSDDYVEQEMYETLHEDIIKYQADFVSCEITDVFDNNRYHTFPNTGVTSCGKEEAYKELLQFSHRLRTSSCCKLFCLKLFDDIRYREGIHSEDIDLLYRIIDKCNTIVMGEKPFYYYVHRSNSISTKKLNVHSFDVIDIADRIVEFINLRYPGLIHYAESFRLRWQLDFLRIIRKSETDDFLKQKDKDIKRSIRHNFFRNIINRKMSISYYILMWSVALGLFKQIDTVIEKGSR